MLDRVQQDALKVVARELRLLREERVCKLQLALRGDGEDLERRGAAAAAAAAEQARFLQAHAQDVDGRSGGMLNAAGESTEDGRKGRGSGSQEELSPENGQRERGCDGRESLLGDAGAGWEGGREGGGDRGTAAGGGSGAGDGDGDGGREVNGEGHGEKVKREDWWDESSTNSDSFVIPSMSLSDNDVFGKAEELMSSDMRIAPADMIAEGSAAQTDDDGDVCNYRNSGMGTSRIRAGGQARDAELEAQNGERGLLAPEGGIIDGRRVRGGEAERLVKLADECHEDGGEEHVQTFSRLKRDLETRFHALSDKDDEDSRPKREEEKDVGPKVPMPQRMTEERLREVIREAKEKRAAQQEEESEDQWAIPPGETPTPRRPKKKEDDGPIMIQAPDGNIYVVQDDEGQNEGVGPGKSVAPGRLQSAEDAAYSPFVAADDEDSDGLFEN